MPFVIYVISISFQLAGALQLIFIISTKRDKVIESFAGKGIISKDNNTKEITYNKKALIV